MTIDRRNRAVALVSGGLDSAVSLGSAMREMDIRLVLFANYGQRALEPERHAVMGIVSYYGLPLREVSLEWLGEISPTGMRGVDSRGTAGPEPALDTVEAVWIPNRNGVFLNAAAAFAESYDCGFVVTGFNREEAQEFSDNSEAYVAHVNHGLELSTQNGVKVVSFTQNLDKREILRLGVELGVPLSVIWSCYRAGARMCGGCASCLRLRQALATLPEETRPPLEFES